MKLATYTLTLGETVNTGNYNNCRYEVSGTIHILPGLSVDSDVEARDSQIEELRVFLRGKAAEIRKTIKGA